MPVCASSTQTCVKSQKENSSIEHTVTQKKKKKLLLAENLPVAAGSKEQLSVLRGSGNWLAEEEEMLQGSNCRDENHLPSPFLLLIYFTYFVRKSVCLKFSVLVEDNK